MVSPAEAHAEAEFDRRLSEQTTRLEKQMSHLNAMMREVGFGSESDGNWTIREISTHLNAAHTLISLMLQATRKS